MYHGVTLPLFLNDSGSIKHQHALAASFPVLSNLLFMNSAAAGYNIPYSMQLKQVIK
jgi:hypothetical protein